MLKLLEEMEVSGEEGWKIRENVHGKICTVKHDLDILRVDEKMTIDRNHRRRGRMIITSPNPFKYGNYGI